MHDVSALFTQIFNDPGHWDEVMLNIAGQEYTQANIVSVSISGGLFDTPGIGNCASRQIDMEIIPIGTIPRQAQIQVFSRVCVDDQQSEWIPKGVFFFSTRETDSTSGVMTVTGYDAMLKAEDVCGSMRTTSTTTGPCPSPWRSMISPPAWAWSWMGAPYCPSSSP